LLLWPVRILAVLLGIVGPLLAIEIGLRLFGPFLPGNYDTGAYLVRHEQLGHFHVSNFDGWIKTNEFTTHVKISPLGLRDRRTSYHKPPGVYRILLLGDSFVEAVQVPTHDSVAERLERALSQRMGGPVEVINAGVAAYGTGQELLLLEQEGFKYQPDLVALVFFVGNDVANNNYRLELWDNDLKLALKPYFDLQRDGSLRLIPGPPPPLRSGPVETLRHCCMLFNVVESGVVHKLGREDPRERLEAIGGPRTPLRGLYDTQPEDEWLRAWKISEALLARVRDRAAGIGAPLVIVGAPESRVLEPDLWRREVAGGRLEAGRLTISAPTDRLGAITRRLNVLFVDLLPAFEHAGAAGGGPFYYDFNKHWTAAGHAVAASAIADALQSSGLVPE
jgi:hypothetical protein